MSAVRRCAPTLAALLLIAGPVRAAVVVSWGGDYVAETRASARGRSGKAAPFNTGDAVNDGIRKAYPFSLTQPLSPAVGADYGGTCATFYGGHADASNGRATYFGVEQIAEVRDAGLADLLHFGATSNENWDHWLASYVAWLRDDFLVDPAETVGFAPTSDLRIDGLRLVTGDVARNFQALRWFAALADGSFYLSEDVTGEENLAAATAYTAGDFASLGWEAVVLQESKYDGMYVEGGAFATPTAALADVVAIGFMVQAYGTSGAGTDRDIQYYQVAEFEVTAQSAAPEPATLALVAFGGLVLLRRRGQVPAGFTPTSRSA